MCLHLKNFHSLRGRKRHNEDENRSRSSRCTHSHTHRLLMHTLSVSPTHARTHSHTRTQTRTCSHTQRKPTKITFAHAVLHNSQSEELNKLLSRTISTTKGKRGRGGDNASTDAANITDSSGAQGTETPGDSAGKLTMTTRAGKRVPCIRYIHKLKQQPTTAKTSAATATAATATAATSLMMFPRLPACLTQQRYETERKGENKTQDTYAAENGPWQ